MSLPQTTVIPPVFRAPLTPPGPLPPAHPPPGPGQAGAGTGHHQQQSSKRLSPILQQRENQVPPPHPPSQSRPTSFNNSSPQQAFPSQAPVFMMQAEQQKEEKQQQPSPSHISAYPSQPTLSSSDDNSSASPCPSLSQSSSNTTPNTSPTTSRKSGRRGRRQSFAVPPVTGTDEDLSRTTRTMAYSRPSSRSREPGTRASARHRQPSPTARKLSSIPAFGSSGSDEENWDRISEVFYSEPEATRNGPRKYCKPSSDSQKHRHDHIRRPRRYRRNESRSRVDEHDYNKEGAPDKIFSVLKRSLSRIARSKSRHRGASPPENHHDRSINFSPGTYSPPNHVSTSSSSSRSQYYDYPGSSSRHAAAAAAPPPRSRQDHGRGQGQEHKHDSRARARGRGKNVDSVRAGAKNRTSSKTTKSKVKSGILILGTVAAASMAARALMKNGQKAARGERERGRKREHGRHYTRRHRRYDDDDNRERHAPRSRTYSRPRSAHERSRHPRHLSSTRRGGGGSGRSSSSSSSSSSMATRDSSAREAGGINCSRSKSRRESDNSHAGRGGPIPMPVLASPTPSRAQSGTDMQGWAPVRGMNAPALALRHQQQHQGGGRRDGGSWSGSIPGHGPGSDYAIADGMGVAAPVPTPIQEKGRALR